MGCRAKRNRPPQNDLLGKNVRKFFPGFGSFTGTIVSFDSSRQFYRVQYEDGDTEDLELEEAEQILQDCVGRGSSGLKEADGASEQSLSGQCGNGVKESPSLKRRKQSRVTRIRTETHSDVKAEAMPLNLRSRKRIAGSEAKELIDTRRAAKQICSPRSARNRERKKQDDVNLGETASEINPSTEPLAVHHRDTGNSRRFLQGRKLGRPVSNCEERSLKDDRPTFQSSVEAQARRIPIGEPEFKLLQSPLHNPPPPSSGDLLVPHDSVLDCLAACSFLRSFSRALFLSPFSLEDFQRAVCSELPTPLLDSVHLCLLQALRRHLERLAEEGSDKAGKCLRQQDWTLLDCITWPSHLMGFLVTYSFEKESESKFPSLDIEYYKVPVTTKLAILNFLCDHLLDTEEIRAEIHMRAISCGARDEITQEYEYTLKMREGFGEPFGGEKFESCMDQSDDKNMDEGDSEMLKETTPLEPTGSFGESFEVEELGSCKDQANDKNIDECVLCGMDGNLICCDGCPAAYHGRCVGISISTLPLGDWFCPECILGRVDGNNPKFVGLRGANLLGVDVHGHTFLSTCRDLLLIKSDPSLGAGLSYYYNCKDLPIILEWLDKMNPVYDDIKKAIPQQWNLVQRRNSMESQNDLACGQKSAGITGSKSELYSAVQTDGRRVRRWRSSHLESTEIYSHGTEGDGLRADKYPTSGLSHPVSNPHSRPYINHYVLGDEAATAAANLAIQIAGQHFPADSRILKKTTKATTINDQLKAFYKAPIQFYWPNVRKKLMELPRERCGWCFACSNPIMKRGCLLNQAAGILAAGAACVPGGVRPTEFGSGHLPSVAGYLLHMEKTLKSLLLGPWKDPNYSSWWQKQVKHAACVHDLKFPLLQLESCLRPVLLSGKWFSGEDDCSLFRCGGSGAVAAILQNRAQHKLSIGVKNSLCDVVSSKWLQSWKRGIFSSKVFQWHSLPSWIARQAGRQGGLKKIHGLIYKEGLEAPQRSRHCAWQARVDAACTVSQVALQVRCLDACIRWDELCSNTLSFDRCADQMALKKLTVYAKKWKGGVPMYLVDSETSSIFLNQFRRKGLKTVSNTDPEEKVWVSEASMPLSLLRQFEERIYSLQQKNQCVLSVSHTWFKKSRQAFKKDVFERLLLKAGQRGPEEALSVQVHKEALSGYMDQCKNWQGSRHTTCGAVNIACNPCGLKHQCDGFPSCISESQSIYASHYTLDKSSDKIEVENKLATEKWIVQHSEGSVSESLEKKEGQMNVQDIPDKRSESSVVTDEFHLDWGHISGKALESKVSNDGCYEEGRAVSNKRSRDKDILKVDDCILQYQRLVDRETAAPSWSCKRNSGTHFSNEGIRWRKIHGDYNDFIHKKIMLPGQISLESSSRPRCYLCSRNYDARLLYVGCEFCPLWFHGDALKVRVENMDEVVGFKCHKCRKKGRPDCPYNKQYMVKEINPQQKRNWAYTKSCE